MNINIERLRRLPRHANESWQAALVRVPAWTEDGSGRPVRPWTALCVSTRTGLAGTTEPRLPEERSPRLVLDSLSSLALEHACRYRPGRLVVNQPEVADDLRPLLAQIGIEIIEQDVLPEVDEAYRHLTNHFGHTKQQPAALSVEGVTIDHLRSFAEAAEDFYEAALWLHLTNDDLIRVASPPVERGLGLVVVMGGGGISTGLGFFETHQQHEDLCSGLVPTIPSGTRDAWSLTYGDVVEIPMGDADIWEDHDLPVADDSAYPLFMRAGADRKMHRPNPRQWAYVEGLLRALAETTESELDSGRWSKHVVTIDGPAEYVLELPGLLEPARTPFSLMRGGIPDRRAMERMLIDMQRAAQGKVFSSAEEYQRFLNENFTGSNVPRIGGKTPLERAEDLAFAAVEARGRKQLHLLRQALEICPDCAEVYVQLAERESRVDKARELYAQGAAAGRRSLGPDVFEQDAGYFWDILETRPFMRALYGLAQTCQVSDRLDEALEHYGELLRLNPDDNQAVRYGLATCLLRTGRLEQVESLLGEYDEASTHWLTLKALTAFAMNGDTEESRRVLGQVNRANPHVRKILSGDGPLPEPLPITYRFGSEEEAQIVVAETLDAWMEIDGAIDWLRQNTRNKQGRGDRWKGIKKKSKKKRKRK